MIKSPIHQAITVYKHKNFKCDNSNLHYDLHRYIKDYSYEIIIDGEKYIISNFNRCVQSDDYINKTIIGIKLTDQTLAKEKITCNIEKYHALSILCLDFMNMSKDTYNNNLHWFEGLYDISEKDDEIYKCNWDYVDGTILYYSDNEDETEDETEDEKDENSILSYEKMVKLIDTISQVFSDMV
jgi:hypothetical protein